MNKIESETLQKSIEVAPVQGGIARRRLLRAGLAAAPLALAVSGRSAMAGTTCARGLSPLAWNSISPNGICKGSSHTVEGSTQIGRSPGLWRPNPNGNTFSDVSWPDPILPFAGYDSSLSYSGIAWTDGRWLTGTKFNDPSFFGSNSTVDRYISRILIEDEGNDMIWHLCAAMLNALKYPEYALTKAEVIQVATGWVGNRQVTDGEIKLFLAQTWN